MGNALSGTLAMARTRDAIVRLSQRGLLADEFLRQVSALVRSVVPFDAAFWSTTDPALVLVTGGLVQNLPLWACQSSFDNELLTPDFNKFTDLARSAQPAAILSVATRGHLDRSARYRELALALGFRDELRVACVVDAACWGVASLLRTDRVFQCHEAAWLGSVASPIAAGLRNAVLNEPGTDSPAPGPGVVVVDRRGAIEALTPAAGRWLAELTELTEREGLRIQPQTPPSVYIVAATARARAAGEGEAPASLRVRTRSGQWLALRAAPLSTPEPASGLLAVVIEPARPAEVASLLVAAYGLSTREQQVLALLARGLGTEEIARTLIISPHTVRDHVKALLAKTGTGSRRELVARVFADHFYPRLHDGRVNVVPLDNEAARK